MQMYDIINDKRYGRELSDEQIAYFIKGYVAGSIPDYQAAALLMAICCRGMNRRETTTLTMEMARSGQMLDLSDIPGIKVDKHSTGGVGDKTSLIVGPIVAACGVPVAKMSGRALGFSGGTIDKLESIPGFQTALPFEKFINLAGSTNICLISQTGDIAPADKKLYALRDVTATVECQPLITSSIMSKKIAAGADAIVLDVKFGRGAFMKTYEDGLALAKGMVDLGEQVVRRTVALVTSMESPLGYEIGTALEVQEAVEVLRGGGPEDLRLVCLELAANMLHLGGKGDIAACRLLAQQALDNNTAYMKLWQMVLNQGGDATFLNEPPTSVITRAVLSPCDGYVSNLDAELCGTASMHLGAGRVTKEDAIDHTAGVTLAAKPGDRVRQGDILAELHTSDAKKIAEAQQLIEKAYTFSEQPPQKQPLILARLTRDGVEEFE
ncbi:MAG: thymidine phosphorylase [Firmicutes bacterium]|nr:thymidine phosphorylase [Bacillota bacterium]